MRVVMLPGFSQTASAWNPVTMLLGPAVKAEAVEVPDDGDFLSVASTVAETQGRACYVGYSMGGRIALQVAVDRPDLVAALVVVSASPGIADHAERRRRCLDDLAFADWIDRHGRDAFLDRWLEMPIFDGLDRALARRHRLPTAPAISSQLRRLSQGIQPPLWHRLGELAMPTMLVAGERDPKYIGIATEMLAAIGLNAKVEIVPDCGHAVPAEWPGAMAAMIMEFLEAHPGASTE
jgi:2-succinyl-6-hydroxy-2,4-cyclohexadiene-1-carboxylate synthase